MFSAALLKTTGFMIVQFPETICCIAISAVPNMSFDFHATFFFVVWIVHIPHDTIQNIHCIVSYKVPTHALCNICNEGIDY